jgi:hypothetical protein
MNNLSSLMERLKIKAVYWVDDENATAAEMDVAKLIKSTAEELSQNTEAETKKMLGQLKKHARARQLSQAIEDILKDPDIEDVAGTVEGQLTKLDTCVEDPVAVLNAMLNALPQPLGPQERAGLTQIFDAQPDWLWQTMSFTRWQAEHDALLQQHTGGDSNALLIVDLQNSKEASLLTGDGVLAQWAKVVSEIAGPLPIYAVALTSKFKEDQELREGRKFTQSLFNAGESPALPVIVISKDRLVPPSVAVEAEMQRTPAEMVSAAFSRALGRLRACTLHHSLAAELESIYSTSSSSAFKQLQQLSIEEMLYAVSSSSFHEGASEIDTLVRMASIAQREALLSNVLTSPNIAGSLIELRGLHDNIGHVSASDLESIDGIEKLRCSELHEPIEVVNKLMSPLSPGDIFEVSGKPILEYYVLVSNACDLMLRSKDGIRKLETGLLLPLRLQDGQKCGTSPMQFPISNFPATSPLASQNRAVDLRQMLTISLDTLDLCWTNQGGTCDWNQDRALPGEFSLLPSQTLRFKELSKRLTEIGSEKHLFQFAGWLSTTSEFSNNPSRLVKVDFSLTRVGRLSSAIASELIQTFAQALSRPSQEHNFSPSVRS